MIINMKETNKDKLNIRIYENKEEMGAAAAVAVAGKLNEAILEKGTANLILATGASQFQFLEHLQKQSVDWKKIVVFHLDEYKGMADSHPASFRKYLKERILNKIQPQEVYYLNGDATDVEAEAVDSLEVVVDSAVVDSAVVEVAAEVAE